jgi:hypothetical protein
LRTGGVRIIPRHAPCAVLADERPGDAIAVQRQCEVLLDHRWTDKKGEYHFVTTALTQISSARDWLQQLLREVRSRDNRYDLCADPARLKQAIELARQAKPISLLSPYHNPGGDL